MTTEYRQATIEDAELLVSIYDASFYKDFLRYGTCPGYGQTKGRIKRTIRRIVNSGLVK